ncbi:branched-chain amino acid ABC transporter permease [Fredinandcohnia onubensis]|uniref:branched-chain amino acid ABC transporter permease n=1 Tax=Fredinandcohnia onubensis TaxID=1571209 RepID=UPI000C0BF2B6|nr:branched-chain amino acid ABC transporter permease [Fredinandcohnia onubensis]
MARSGNFHINYRQEITLLNTVNRKLYVTLAIILSLGLPLFLGNYWLNTLNFALIAVIGALGLNILTGLTGLISIGHGAFVAIGAYVAAILSSYGFSFILVLFLTAIITMLFGFIVGLPALRLEGLYLAVSTFVFHFIVLYVIAKLSNFTGGHNGMSITKPVIGSWVVNTQLEFYFLIIPFVIGLIILAINIKFRSKLGRALVAIRDSDVAAATMGINLIKYKVLAFGISSFYAGIAGCLFAYLVGFISPDHFSIEMSIGYLAMLIAGGMGTIPGAVIGALFISILPEGLRMAVNFFNDLVPQLTSMFALLSQSVYGLIIILFLMFEPKGLYGIWKNIKGKFDSFPYKHSE